MVLTHGSCHCGEVNWTVDFPGDKLPGHVICHCGACAKMGGGAFSLNQVVPKSAFKLTKGDLKKYVYKGDSGNETDCFYCGNCTSNAYHHQHVMGPDTYVVRTGLIDEFKDQGIDVEVYGKDRAKWQPELAKTFETSPPS